MKNGYRNRRGMGTILATPNACNFWPFSLLSACAIQTPAQIIADTSAAGPALSPEAQQQASQMASQAITAFMGQNPADTANYDASLLFQDNPASYYGWKFNPFAPADPNQMQPWQQYLFYGALALGGALLVGRIL